MKSEGQRVSRVLRQDGVVCGIWGGGSKGKVERDGRVGGGVSGTDYPWKAINLPWDMDKRQRREERMHVRGHIRANTHVECMPVDSGGIFIFCPSNPKPAPYSFFVSQNRKTNCR